MDRRIPPEPSIPVAPIRRDALELKVKQGIHKEAFDSALLRADHRRTMDSRDRVVLAGVKQSHIALGQNSHNTVLGESSSEGSRAVKSKELRKSELTEMKHSEPGLEFFHAQLSLQEFTAAASSFQGASGAVRTLNDESVAMLFKKINSNQCAPGDSITLELIDDPSGVVGITLTKGMNNSWDINLVLAPQEEGCDADENELSQSLMTQLQQSGVLVSTVSVDINQRATFSKG